MTYPYEVIRVMNNNVLLAKNPKKNIEVVLMGKGIGFGKKKNQVVRFEPEAIERSFIASAGLKQNYLQMMEEVNKDIVEICTEIILYAEKKLGELSERSYIVIVDHISFALEKMKKQIVIENPFSYEIAQLYPEEYAIGEYARKRILEVLKVDITADEVGFIALHLNAAKEHVGVSDTLKNTRIIKAMIELVQQELDISLQDMPRLNNRFLLHLRGFLDRIDDGDMGDVHSLFETTVKECSEAFGIARKLGDYVSREKKKQILDTDIFYLTLHIDRLIRKSKSM